jgi:hypothetical protein
MPGLIAMSDQLSIADKPIVTLNKVSNVVISPWVNEPYPPLHKLLSSHDVARLTRRPSWLIASLSLIGRFPQQITSRGRRTGWLRSEVLDWMARELAVATQPSPKPAARARTRSRQPCLPLESANSRATECPYVSRRPNGRCNSHTTARRPKRATP